MDWAKTTARQVEEHLSFLIGCGLYKRFYGKFKFFLDTPYIYRNPKEHRKTWREKSRNLWKLNKHCKISEKLGFFSSTVPWSDSPALNATCRMNTAILKLISQSMLKKVLYGGREKDPWSYIWLPTTWWCKLGSRASTAIVFSYQ